MTVGTGPAPPSRPQWGMVVGDIAETPHRHPDGADGVRPEHGALACCE